MDRKVDIYTTLQGDMWDGISHKVYGSDRYSMELIKANIRYANVVKFSSGIDLICPDIPSTSEILPPWRQQ
ncbi:hypothetical protein PM10SUCC1_28780 [Propionigenium maris DSM 9537]|uniref:Phage Tail Protein X n=1 Tax=Propionigenium maris DSM 9537 TaxID=1123000 RepID=A0A9W6LNW7_9FUSO|nr:tail protein X [Propionigenium maris]GLI57364.1 hypothetical protein PM10SUCC1_28780 [Propionigenium maris DSM 9537]